MKGQHTINRTPNGTAKHNILVHLHGDLFTKQKTWVLGF
jgi:hypothetical protein